jgi:hypothetical protein
MLRREAGRVGRGSLGESDPLFMLKSVDASSMVLSATFVCRDDPFASEN